MIIDNWSPCSMLVQKCWILNLYPWLLNMVIVVQCQCKNIRFRIYIIGYNLRESLFSANAKTLDFGSVSLAITYGNLCSMLMQKRLILDLYPQRPIWKFHLQQSYKTTHVRRRMQLPRKSSSLFFSACIFFVNAM